MKMTIVSTNRLIAAMMMMAMTAAMPAMAGNKHHNNRDKKVVAVVDKKKTHFDRVDKHTAHFDKRHAYHPEMRICTFKLSRHNSPTKMMARAERINGVKDTKYNPRTREITVLYDANKTTARHIKHVVA